MVVEMDTYEEQMKVLATMRLIYGYDLQTAKEKLTNYIEEYPMPLGEFYNLLRDGNLPFSRMRVVEEVQIKTITQAESYD